MFVVLPKSVWDAARPEDSRSARLAQKHLHHQRFIKQKTLKGGCIQKPVFWAWKNVRETFIIVFK